MNWEVGIHPPNSIFWRRQCRISVHFFIGRTFQWARDLFQGFLNYKFKSFHSYSAIHIISNLMSCVGCIFQVTDSFILSYIYMHSCSQYSCTILLIFATSVISLCFIPDIDHLCLPSLNLSKNQLIYRSYCFPICQCL